MVPSYIRLVIDASESSCDFPPLFAEPCYLAAEILAAFAEIAALLLLLLPVVPLPRICCMTLSVAAAVLLLPREDWPKLPA